MKRRIFGSGIHLGAAFLMATSAIGPGFLTQTAVFTVQLGASFAFVILLSVLLDLGAQLNIWRIITAAGKPAPVVAEAVQPGFGHVLTLLIVLGGWAFNIGNLAGCGLGLQVLTGMPPVWGATLSAVLALGIFWVKDAGRALDAFARVLGLGMIILTAYVAFVSHPPLAPVFRETFLPQKLDVTAVLTLVGGTVGGYITFAGAHRLLDAGLQDTAVAGRSAANGILVATIMRILLFLAAWGVVATGAAVDMSNPAASLFQTAAGQLGYYFFGVVMWAASITSVTGATFTSLSFLTASAPVLEPRRKWLTAAFIVLSLLVFAWVGRPVKTLVLVGALNGLILPAGLALMLLAARRPDIVGNFRLARELEIAGWLAVAAMGFMAAQAFLQ